MNTTDAARQAEEAVAADKFLLSMDKFAPTIPDELIEYYLQKTGFNCSDVRVHRIIGLAAQKFISEVIDDSLQHSKVRMQNPAYKSKGKDKKLVLTMEDLSTALREYGITVRKPEYFTDKEGPPLREGHPLLKAPARERAEKPTSDTGGGEGTAAIPQTPAPATPAPGTPAPAAKTPVAASAGTKRKADGSAGTTPSAASSTPSMAGKSKQPKKSE